MKLTYEQIKSITVGALWTEQAQDGIHFYKCTKKQNEAWDALSDSLGDRARTTTGVRLDFYTDSKEFRFNCASNGKYELHINNLLRARFRVGKDGPSVGEDIVCPINDPLGNPLEEARITLYLPSHSIGVLASVELDDGAYVRTPAYDCKLLMLGDSITQGWDTEFDSFSYAYMLSRTLNANSVIQGIGGAMFHESTLDTLPFDPDVITVAYGTNDYGGRYKTYDELRLHVTKFLDGLASLFRGKKIFVISPIWRGQPGAAVMGSFEGCRAIIIEEAERRGMIHIDGLAMVPPIPSLFADGWLHPNALGYGFYGENAIREILKHL